MGVLQEQQNFLSAPTNVVALFDVVKQWIQITWTDNSSDEDNFRMEVDVDGGGFNFLVDPAANATSHNHTPVTPGSEYTYRIRAEKGAEFSAWATSNGETVPI